MLRFHARHADGQAKVRIDELEVIESTLGHVLDRMRGPVFDDARSTEGFAKAGVDRETGTVGWPGGADLAPDTLHGRVRTRAWPESRLRA
jgi:hypothetical protein